MAIVTDRHTYAPNETGPSFGEIVYCGPVRGIYIGKYASAQYIVHWDGNDKSSISPAGMVNFTGRVDEDYIIRHVIEQHSSLGPKVGERIQKRRIQDLLKKDKDRKVAVLNKGSEPGDAASDFMSKHDHINPKELPDVSEKTCCLGCNALIEPDYDSIEPYYCKKCIRKMGFLYSPNIKGGKG